MANPATTHVIEIEAGIGEPAFIPLSMGSELQPISVGKKGMWRIESPRVLDVHAFVYFDGTSLFLQSADDANAASVDGYRVGKAWTELSAPCHIEIGQARLKFRSLANDEDSATQIAPNVPVAAPPGGPGGFKSGSQPGASMPVAVAAAPPVRINNATGSRPNEANAPPVMSFPKTDRPFKPGEFSQPPDDESTRIAPLESTGAGRIVSGAHPVPRPPTGAMPVQPLQFPQAMMGVPPPPGDGAPLGMMNAQQGFDAQMQMMPGPPGFDQAPMPFSNPNGPSSPMMGAPMMGQLPPMGQPVPGAPGSYPGQQPIYNNGMPNGIYPGMMGPGPLDVPQPGLPPPAPPQKTYDKLKVALGGTSPITAFAGLVIILGGVLFLYADDEPPPPPRRSTPSASASAAGGSSSGAASLPTTPPVATLLAPPGADAGAPMAGGSAAWPPGVPCPPPNWPAGTPLPCTPNSVAANNPPITDAGANRPDSSRPDKSDNSRGGSKSPSTPTLERQAVDHVAAGETAKAAADYDELVRREPNNRVYAEAARILRAKLDAGAP